MAGVPAITAGMLDALSGTLEGGAAAAIRRRWLLGAGERVAVLLGDTEKGIPAARSVPIRSGVTGGPARTS
jgi:hypothetical protein